MKPNKLKKIRAILNNPASTANEKEICRKLLAKHPEAKPPEVQFKFRPSFETPEEAFKRQAAQAQQSAFYNAHTGQAAAQRAAANQQEQARQRGEARQAGFNFGLGGGGFLNDLFGFYNPSVRAPKQNYSQAEYERAQANINAQRRQQERNVLKLEKNKFLENLAKALRKDKNDTNEGD